MGDELDARLRHAADIVRDDSDDGLVDHIVMLFTKESSDGESWIALRTTSHMPRWTLKGILVDALDMVAELEDQ